MTKLEQRCRELVKKWRRHAKEDYENGSTAKSANADRLKTSAAIFSWVAEELNDELLAILPQRKPKAKKVKR